MGKKQDKYYSISNKEYSNYLAIPESIKEDSKIVSDYIKDIYKNRSTYASILKISLANIDKSDYEVLLCYDNNIIKHISYDEKSLIPIRINNSTYCMDESNNWRILNLETNDVNTLHKKYTRDEILDILIDINLEEESTFNNYEKFLLNYVNLDILNAYEYIIKNYKAKKFSYETMIFSNSFEKELSKYREGEIKGNFLKISKREEEILSKNLYPTPDMDISFFNFSFEDFNGMVFSIRVIGPNTIIISKILDNEIQDLLSYQIDVFYKMLKDGHIGKIFHNSLNTVVLLNTLNKMPWDINTELKSLIDNLSLEYNFIYNFLDFVINPICGYFIPNDIKNFSSKEFIQGDTIRIFLNTINYIDIFMNNIEKDYVIHIKKYIENKYEYESFSYEDFDNGILSNRITELVKELFKKDEQ